MNINIKHLAKLSRLNTTPEQESVFTEQMQSIVEMCEKLPAISSNESLVDASNPMVCRKDVIETNFRRDDILSNAPQVQAGCVVVPRVIE